MQLESLTVQTGIGGSPFNLDPIQYSWIEHSWWTNIWLVIRRYNIQIIGQANILELWAENERFIMKDMREVYNMTHHKPSLQNINRV